MPSEDTDIYLDKKTDRYYSIRKETLTNRDFEVRFVYSGMLAQFTVLSGSMYFFKGQKHRQGGKHSLLAFDPDLPYMYGSFRDENNDLVSGKMCILVRPPGSKKKRAVLKYLKATALSVAEPVDYRYRMYFDNYDDVVVRDGDNIIWLCKLDKPVDWNNSGFQIMVHRGYQEF